MSVKIIKYYYVNILGKYYCILIYFTIELENCYLIYIVDMGYGRSESIKLIFKHGEKLIFCDK